MNQRREGFTVIETMTVIAIIAILAAILFPVFARAREKARRVSCISNLAQLRIAMAMYAQDHAGWFPLPNRLGALMPYAKNSQLFKCPSSSPRSEVYEDGSYVDAAYLTDAGLRNDDPGSRRVLWDSSFLHSDRANVAYLSGRTESLDAQEWKRRGWTPLSEPGR